ncbi:MAG: 1-phosphofructokinase, partial [Enterorhabdus sp.]|nr:1-phosphofructokinase [Enterorhabdus sp.]
MFLTVTCNPALDWMMRLPAFAEGVTNRSAADDLSYGGKGVNVATMLHRFGQDACASGFIAGTTGTALVEGVEAAGVPCDFVRLDAGQTRINVKMKRPRADGSLEETEING